MTMPRRHAIARMPLATAALLLLAACGGGKLEGADTTGTIPNAAGYDAPRSYDTAATPDRRDSTTGQATPGSSRRAGPAGDTLTVRPRPPR
jgi:hypothetical protein